MQSGSNAEQILKDLLIERLKSLLAKKVIVYNPVLYIENLNKSLTIPTYSDILKKGTIEKIDTKWNRVTVHIDLQKLKSFRSKLIKQIAAYALLKDFKKLEVYFIIYDDDTLSIHRRLLGPTNESI
jgi:hypothetical protein